MKKFKHNLTRTLAALLMLSLFTLSASALTLDQARNQKLVKETASGYLVAVKPSAEVNALVKKVNAGRKSAYQKIAKKQGAPLSAVEQGAGKKLNK
jgi:uncharacterized protein YdbL (DUF1318 family)